MKIDPTMKWQSFINLFSLQNFFGDELWKFKRVVKYETVQGRNFFDRYILQVCFGEEPCNTNSS